MKILKRKIGEMNFHSKILQTTYKDFTKKMDFYQKNYQIFTKLQIIQNLQKQ